MAFQYASQDRNTQMAGARQFIEQQGAPLTNQNLNIALDYLYGGGGAGTPAFKPDTGTDGPHGSRAADTEGGGRAAEPGGGRTPSRDRDGAPVGDTAADDISEGGRAPPPGFERVRLTRPHGTPGTPDDIRRVRGGDELTDDDYDDMLFMPAAQGAAAGLGMYLADRVNRRIRPTNPGGGRGISPTISPTGVGPAGGGATSAGNTGRGLGTGTVLDAEFEDVTPGRPRVGGPQPRITPTPTPQQIGAPGTAPATELNAGERAVSDSVDIGDDVEAEHPAKGRALAGQMHNIDVQSDVDGDILVWEGEDGTLYNLDMVDGGLIEKPPGGRWTETDVYLNDEEVSSIGSRAERELQLQDRTRFNIDRTKVPAQDIPFTRGRTGSEATAAERGASPSVGGRVRFRPSVR